MCARQASCWRHHDCCFQGSGASCLSSAVASGAGRLAERAHAPAQVPAANGVIDGDEIIYRDYIDISIAVATPKGLVVPVLRNADELSFAGVEKVRTHLPSSLVLAPSGSCASAEMLVGEDPECA